MHITGDILVLHSYLMLKIFKTIIGSPKFQVIVFTPNQKMIKAAPHTDLLQEQLKDVALCLSNVQEAVKPINDLSIEFMYPALVCVIAAETSSQDLVWFLKIDEIKDLIEDSVDDYGHHVASGFHVIQGRYLEWASEKSNGINYCIINVFLFKESALSEL